MLIGDPLPGKVVVGIKTGDERGSKTVSGLCLAGHPTRDR
jgi:hypothetical protein